MKPILAQVHDEVLARYYGCGLVLPEALEDLTVLDLGCGAGRDVFVLSKLVGEHGRVIGVDMTEEQLAVARRHEDYHRKAFGYPASNVRFLHGYIERLRNSNWPMPVSTLLYPIACSTLLPTRRRCCGGMAGSQAGWRSVFFRRLYRPTRTRTVDSRPRAVWRMPERRTCTGTISSSFAERTGLPTRGWLTTGELALTMPNWARVREISVFTPPPTGCSSWTILNRLAKTMVKPWFIGAPYRIIAHAFVLDKHHRIEAGKYFPVCGNTWRMLHDTRFATHFDFYGNFERHYGIFPGCGMGLPYDDSTHDSASKRAGGCC